MSKYHRPKREEVKKSPKCSITIELGSSTDGLQVLKPMCNDTINHLAKTLDLKDGEEQEVVLWTSFGIPELIGIATISKNNDGLITYSIDYSQSTL